MLDKRMQESLTVDGGSREVIVLLTDIDWFDATRGEGWQDRRETGENCERDCNCLRHSESVLFV